MRRLRGWIVLALIVMLSGCLSTSITVRVPKDVAMIRAFGRDGGGNGKAMETWLKESQKTQRFEAVGDTIADSIGYICTAISPFTIISTVSAHWARVVESCNDAETFKWKISDDRIKSIETDLSYDARDHPRFRTKIEVYEKPRKE